jgi:DNA polymerase elongation subunit (family B)
MLYFNIHRDFDTNQIKQIRARHKDVPYVSFEGNEEIILKEFHEFVLNNDPDILISTRNIIKT